MVSALGRAAKDPSINNLQVALEAVEMTRRKDVLALPPVGEAAQNPVQKRLVDSARANLALVDSGIRAMRELLLSAQLRNDDLPLKDRTKALLDLCNCLERLQKIERTALGLDRSDGQAGTTNVVIVVPAKLSEADWSRSVGKAVVADDE
jgi:hypothetical protein